MNPGREARGGPVTARRDRPELPGLRLAAAANVGVRFLIELEAGKKTSQLGKTMSVLTALGIDISLTTTDGNI